MHQNTESVAATETLAEVPEHVLRGLPEEVRLFPSAVDKTRIGVWATKPILKGKKFGPFVGDKKKRSRLSVSSPWPFAPPWISLPSTRALCR